MDIILLERVAKLGQMGDVVSVKSGYARNFLIPRKRALRATRSNKADFAERKVHIEAQNLENRTEAEKIAEKIADKQIVLIRQASESGQLYGSVSAKDITDALGREGLAIERRQVQMNNRFKMLGIFNVTITLHAEVSCTVKMNIAKSAGEASQQWTRYQNGESALMTATEEEIIEERRLRPNKFR
ncbi:MAG: 50S ribosomal protein L9 [Alphaproteobacteria bacterium]|nr:50S ribosomal protein L9 [Alphaproteobacteria bacterium]